VKLLRSDSNVEFLGALFPELEFSFFSSDDDAHFISCFVAFCPDENLCEKHWADLTSNISINYQEALSSDVAAWNIYLAIVCPKNMNKHLKYKIENDRFALRKLVLDGEAYSSLEADAISQALEAAILGSDLVLKPDSELAGPSSYTSPLREFLDNLEVLPLDGKEKSISIRRQRISELISWRSAS
jgi:hypothetical protein